MAKIVPKLNLNKVPQDVENNSLVFAKNIKLASNNIIGPDNSIENIELKFYALKDENGNYILYDDLEAYKSAGGNPGVIEVFDGEYGTGHGAIDTPFDDGGGDVTPVGPKSSPSNTKGGGIGEYTGGDGSSYVGNPIISDQQQIAIEDLEQAKEEEYSEYAEVYSKYELINDEIIGNITIPGLKKGNSTKGVVSNLHHSNIDLGQFSIPDGSVKSSIIGHIVGINNIIYLFVAIWSNDKGKGTPFYRIVEYNEITKKYKILLTDWNYSGGKITGCVTTNMANEIILSIAEYFEEETDKIVPLKHLNITKIKEEPTKYVESLYTQAPIVPITNLLFVRYYQCTIPNGVYQFFIRYKISKGNYTKWFPCSKELYATNIKKVDTVQGTVKYMETTRDASTSFVFRVEHINNVAKEYYEEFQLGFLLSHDDTVVAREWKHFNIYHEDEIYFDYLQQDIKEINQTEILDSVYELFNVKNITLFKDKLYIANYKENNPNGLDETKLKQIANDITAHLTQINLPSSDTGRFDGKQLNSPIPGVSDSYTMAGEVALSSYFRPYVFYKEKNVVGSTTDKFKVGLFQIRYNSGHSYGECNIVCVYSYEIYNQIYDNSQNDRRLETVHTHNSDNEINNETYFSHAGYGMISDRDNHPLNFDSSYNGVTVKGVKGYWYGGSRDDWEIKFYANLTRFWHTEGIGDEGRTNIANVIRDINLTRFTLPKGGVIAVYVKIITENGSQTDYLQLAFYGNSGAYSYNKQFTSNNHESEAENCAINEIKKYIKGICVNTNGDTYFYFEKDNLKGKLESYKVVYDEYTEITDERENNGYGDEMYFKQSINLNYKTSTMIRSLAIKPSILSAPKDTGFENQINTLLPFTSYKFFIHFVQANGVITNGYPINNNTGVSLESFDTNIDKGIIYPIFKGIDTTSLIGDYVAYFFSILKVGAEVAECFNINLVNNNNDVVCDCLELDTLLYPLIDNISVVNKINKKAENIADYHPSYDTEDNTKWFGDSGKVLIEGVTDLLDISNNPLVGKTDIRHFTLNYSGLRYITDESPFRDLLVKENDTVKDYKQCFIYQIINNAETHSIWLGFNTTDEEIKQALSGVKEIRRYSTGNSRTVQLSIDFEINNAINMKVYSGAIYAYGGGNMIEVYDNYSNRTKVFREGSDGITAGNTVGILEDYIKSLKYYEVNKEEELSDIKDGFFWIRTKDNKTDFNGTSALTKLTPYIPINGIGEVEYNNSDDLNSPGFLCKVYKPTAGGTNLYVSGSDIYNRNINDIVSQQSMNVTENESYVSVGPTNYHYIYSNYNLNCLQLSEDIVPKIRSYKIDANDDNKKARQIVLLFQSSTLSDIYKLPSMYKDYLKKYFYPVESVIHTKFDKTIRASYVDADRENNLGYYFNPTDFYNIASNRGDIIKMFAINNSVIVHTEHSMFKFNGNSTINASDTDITMAESDIFDIGISEIFDAEHGYAGIMKKEHGIATFEYYLFYDALAKKIYGYDGNPTLQRLSDSIQYLLDSLITDTTDIILAADTDNNRIFVNIRNANGNVCLSYNILTKSFISIHDIDFTQSFNTRTNSYLIRRINETEEVGVDKPSYYDIIGSFAKNNYLYYGSFYKTSVLYINDMKSGKNYREACVDIIYNNAYEKIKVLNFIQWVCSEIKKYVDDENDSFDLLGNINISGTSIISVSEEELSKYAGHYLRIYSDQCYTNNIPLCRLDNNNNWIPNIQNDEELMSDITKVNNESFSYPRYNNGVWSFNYFNDIKNKEDIFKYDYYVHKVTGNKISKASYDSLSDTLKLNYKKLVNKADNNSLMYGKYFVVRFIFRNKNFKLENVVFNINDYGKS